MDRNSISLIIICPVLFCVGCGGEPSREIFTDTGSPEGFAEKAAAFRVERPDSLESYLLWSGDSPLKILETYSDEIVEAGDTAALGSDPFLEIETDRLTMELHFAVATGDSGFADSLRAVLADSSVYVPVIYGAGGRADLRVYPGDEIQPGDTIASVTGPPSDSVFVIMPGTGHLVWPDEVEGMRLPSGGLRVNGPFPGDSMSIAGFYTVASHFIHEEGLATFLVTAGGDTLYVTVTANANGTRTVYSPVPLDSLILSGWD